MNNAVLPVTAYIDMSQALLNHHPWLNLWYVGGSRRYHAIKSFVEENLGNAVGRSNFGGSVLVGVGVFSICVEKRTSCWRWSGGGCGCGCWSCCRNCCFWKSCGLMRGCRGVVVVQNRRVMVRFRSGGRWCMRVIRHLCVVDCMGRLLSMWCWVLDVLRQRRKEGNLFCPKRRAPGWWGCLDDNSGMFLSFFVNMNW